MDSDDYTSPSLIGLDTKEKQLEALQIVREGATAQYTDLVSEDERINKKLKQMIKSLGHNVGNYFIGGTEEIHQPDGRDEVIDQTNLGNYFTVGGPLISEKNQGSTLQYQMQPPLAKGVLQAHKGSVAVQKKHDYMFRSPV